MSFNFIYNPLTNEKYSIFSYEGKSLLKQYIKDYQTGGSGSSEPKNMSDWIIQGDRRANKRKIEECEKELRECGTQINDVKSETTKFKDQIVELYKKTVDKLGKKDKELAKKDQECEEKIAEKDQELAKKDQELAEKDKELVGKDQELAGKDQECEEKIAEKNKEIAELESTLIDTQIPIPKNVEEKVGDVGTEPLSLSVSEENPDNIIINGVTITLEEEQEKGKGTSKIVYRIVYEGKEYALAKIPKEGLDQARHDNELNCLKNLNHPNILKVFATASDNKFHYVLMEYGDQDLSFFRGYGSKPSADNGTGHKLLRNFLIDMSNALSYLKKMNVNHRDIKLENFLLVNDTVKLIDFGISTRCPETEGYSLERALSVGTGKDGDQTMFKLGGGTQMYVAPENVGKGSLDTHKGDIFALGLCIIELFYDKELKEFDEHQQSLINVQDTNKRLSNNYPLKINNQKQIRILKTELGGYNARLNIAKENNEEDDEKFYKNLIEETTEKINKLKETDNMFISEYYKTYDELYHKINESVFSGKPIIQGMLEYKPEKRIKIDDVLEALGAPVEVEGAPVEVEGGAGKED